MSFAPYSVSANRRPYLGFARRVPPNSWIGPPDACPGMVAKSRRQTAGTRIVTRNPADRRTARAHAPAPLGSRSATDRPRPVREALGGLHGGLRRRRHDGLRGGCGTGPTRNRSGGAGPASAAASFSRSRPLEHLQLAGPERRGDVHDERAVRRHPGRPRLAATGAPTASGQARRIGSSDSAPDDGGSIAPSRSPTRFTPAGNRLRRRRPGCGRPARGRCAASVVVTIAWPTSRTASDQPRAPVGVELGQHVVEQQHRRRAAQLGDQRRPRPAAAPARRVRCSPCEPNARSSRECSCSDDVVEVRAGAGAPRARCRGERRSAHRGGELGGRRPRGR